MQRKTTINKRSIILTAAITMGLIFTVGCAPVIYDFNPERGQPGTEVTINGKRFSENASGNTVKFKGVSVPQSDILFASKNQLKVKVPPGAVTGTITVATSKGSDESETNFIVPGETAWTFMVYMAADNNLEGAGLDDFTEMASVQNTDSLNIVVQFDRASGHSTGYGDWKDTRRFVITNGDTPSMTPVQNMGELNMGDPDVLQDFVEWGIDNYPADHYALVIWNHGGGWRAMKQRLDSMAITAKATANPDCGVARAVAWDDASNDKLYMKEVQTALQGAKQGIMDRYGTDVKLDLVGFDACLMGMIEVAYALRNTANYVVGSEDLEPFDGWPYDAILSKIVQNPSIMPRDLASRIVDDYASSYSGQSGITQSAVDISKINDLVSKLNLFTTAANTEWGHLADARDNASQFHPSWSMSYWGVDLCGFLDEVYNRVPAGNLKTAADNARNALHSFVVRSKCSSGMSGVHGTAIYFPPDLTAFNSDPDHTAYDDANTFMTVDFVKYNQWDNWLQDFYANAP